MTTINLNTRLGQIPTPLESFDSIFGGTQGRLVSLKLSDLEFNIEQMTKMNTQEELEQMAESIKAIGVKEPILVREMECDETHLYKYYQVLNGRNRTTASRMAGMEEIPAIIEKATDDEARYIIATTTLSQRHSLSISEKAWAYRMQMEAIKQISGKRTDLMHNVHKVDSMSSVAAESNESRRTIAYYIRLTNLTKELLELVDTNTLPFRAGVYLSYLKEEEQELLFTYLQQHKIKLSLSQAEDLKRYSEELGFLSDEVIQRTLEGKEKQPKDEKLSISLERIQSFLPSKSKKEVETHIMKALEFYKKYGEKEINFKEVN